MLRRSLLGLLLTTTSAWAGGVAAPGVPPPTGDQSSAVYYPSSGGGGCAQATAYLARTTGGNEGGNAANITTLICGLVTDGVITGPLTGATGCGSKLDGLWILAQQNAADALLNLCGTSYSLTSNGTFTSNKGYAAFTGPGMASGFNPTVGSPKFSQNSGSIGAWAYAIVSDTAGQMAISDVNGGTQLFDDFSGSFYPRVNAIGSPAVGTTPGLRGLYVGDRNVAASLEGYWNGVDQGTVTASSAALTSGILDIGCTVSPSGCTVQTLSEAHIGASLGATLNLALYNRLRTYMTAVGVP